MTAAAAQASEDFMRTQKRDFVGFADGDTLRAESLDKKCQVGPQSGAAAAGRQSPDSSVSSTPTSEGFVLPDIIV